MLMVSVELQELKQALAMSHPYPIMPETKTSIQPKMSLSKTNPLSLDETSKVAHLDPK
jgi:hypothetical protein